MLSYKKIYCLPQINSKNQFTVFLIFSYRLINFVLSFSIFSSVRNFSNFHLHFITTTIYDGSFYPLHRLMYTYFHTTVCELKFLTRFFYHAGTLIMLYRKIIRPILFYCFILNHICFSIILIGLNNSKKTTLLKGSLFDVYCNLIVYPVLYRKPYFLSAYSALVTSHSPELCTSIFTWNVFSIFSISK